MINPYLTKYDREESSLYEDLYGEACRFSGINVYYLPRTIINYNGIFNEESLVKFGSQYIIEATVESFDSFEGDGDLIEKFGMSIRDQLKITIPKRAWSAFVGKYITDTEQVRPYEGDLIYIPDAKALWEIKYADLQNDGVKLFGAFGYSITLEMFEYSSEEIDTDVDEINVIERNFAPRTKLEITASSGDFHIGEDISGNVNGVNVIAEVAGIEDDGSAIEIVTEKADDGSNTSLIAGITITGDSSGTTATIQTVDDWTPMAKDQMVENTDFEIDGNNFIDFTKVNPFGMPDAI
jgi:hypothetical protein